MHAGPQHLALLPAAETPKPWETVVAATYANLKNLPVIYSRSGSGGKGRWISPGQAVVVDEEEDGSGGGEERVEYAKRLTKVGTRVYCCIARMGGRDSLVCLCLCVRVDVCVFFYVVRGCRCGVLGRVAFIQAWLFWRTVGRLGDPRAAGFRAAPEGARVLCVERILLAGCRCTLSRSLGGRG